MLEALTGNMNQHEWIDLVYAQHDLVRAAGICEEQQVGHFLDMIVMVISAPKDQLDFWHGNMLISLTNSCGLTRRQAVAMIGMLMVFRRLLEVDREVMA